MRIGSKERYRRNLLRFTLICVIGGIAFFFYMGYPYFLSYGHTHPQRAAVCCITPRDLGMEYEEIALTTRDGVAIRGWYIPGSSRAAVVLLHPMASNRVGMLNMAKELHGAGYGTALIDLRRHGQSGGEVLPFGGPETEDVRAAVDYLSGRTEVDSQRIGVLGWSLGAQAGLLSAARDPRIRAVVADGPGAVDFEDWPPPGSVMDLVFVPFDRVYYWMLPYRTGVRQPLSIVDALTQIAPRPLLIISASAATERRRMEFYRSKAGPGSDLWVVPGTSHLQGYNKDRAEYCQRVIGFLDRTLKGE